MRENEREYMVLYVVHREIEKQRKRISDPAGETNKVTSVHAHNLPSN